MKPLLYLVDEFRSDGPLVDTTICFFIVDSVSPWGFSAIRLLDLILRRRSAHIPTGPSRNQGLVQPQTRIQPINPPKASAPASKFMDLLKQVILIDILYCHVSINNYFPVFFPVDESPSQQSCIIFTDGKHLHSSPHISIHSAALRRDFARQEQVTVEKIVDVPVTNPVDVPSFPQAIRGSRDYPVAGVGTHGLKNALGWLMNRGDIPK